VSSRTSPLVEWRRTIVESDLGSSVRLVALVLSLHMDRNGGSCFPSLTTLERETGLARKTVWTSIDTLEHAGLIARERHRGRVSHYRALGAPVTYSLGDSENELGDLGNELGANRHLEDVQEDAQEDVQSSPTGRKRPPGAMPARALTARGQETHAAKELVAGYVRLLREAGGSAPADLRGRMGKQARRLLDGGTSAPTIERALKRMVEKGLARPSLLPEFVTEVELELRRDEDDAEAWKDLDAYDLA
jgi:Helix-turn-helix domain